MAQPAFLRARRPEHKRQRREAILDAARELALRSGVRNVSLGDVGAAVGLAKSAVVRYFATREEIYLEITAESWRDWAEDTTARLRAATGLEQVVDALVEPLAARPLFCDLLGQTPISLEHNISVEVALDFKRTVLRTVGEVAAELTAAHPVLTGEEGFELVGAACALAGTLHPMAHPPAVMAQIYAEHPDLAATCPEFAPTLRRTLTALALGLPTLRTPDPARPADRLPVQPAGPEAPIRGRRRNPRARGHDGLSEGTATRDRAGVTVLPAAGRGLLPVTGPATGRAREASPVRAHLAVGDAGQVLGPLRSGEVAAFRARMRPDPCRRRYERRSDSPPRKKGSPLGRIILLLKSLHPPDIVSTL